MVNRTAKWEHNRGHPAVGEVERERVPQIARGWRESVVIDASNVTLRNGRSRGEWLGENERERVRIVREWMQMTSQQRGSRVRQREELELARAREQADHVHEGSFGDNEEVQTEHGRRDMLRLRGRRALLELLVRIESDRQREIQGLLEHRAVSDFALHNRIQVLLRGRCLRIERTVEDERPQSRAATELTQLRQRHTVSGLRTNAVSQNFGTDVEETEKKWAENY